MLSLRIVVTIISFGMMALGAGGASGQDYPNKPVRIVTGSPGSIAEYTARLTTQGLFGPLGQPVIIDSRPSGMIPGDTVAKAKPDGYTLLVYGSTFWIGPLLQQAPYDPVKDFSPISLINRSFLVIAAHPSLPVKSLKEVIALAKSRPGELNYASSPLGASTHLAMELFKSMAGVNIVRVPYKGDGAALSALLGGEVELAFITGVLITPQLRTGKLKALAVTTAEPSALFPGVPTVAATLPGYEALSMFAMFAPAKTPAAIIGRLNQEVVRALNTADIKEKFLNVGFEVAAGSPDELAIAMKSDMARLGKVIKDAGIKAD